MRAQRIVLVLALLGVACSQDEEQPQMDCSNPTAATEAAGRRGVTDVALDGDFQTWQAACMGASVDLAVLYGRARVDLTRLARLIFADKISPAEYLAGV